MSWLLRFPIGARLSLAFATLLVLLVITAGYAVTAVIVTSGFVTSVYQERAVPLQRLSEFNQLLQRNRALLMDMLIDPGRANVQRNLDEFRANDQRLRELWQTYRTERAEGQEQQLAQNVEEALTEYLDRALGAAAQAMADHRYDDAQELYLSRVKPLEPDIQRTLAALLERKLEQANTE